MIFLTLLVIPMLIALLGPIFGSGRITLKEFLIQIAVQTVIVVASVLNFPQIDLGAIDIITSAETEEVFQTKRSAPIDLRGGK